MPVVTLPGRTPVLTIFTAPMSCLLQIQKIMEDKGYDHAAAFTRQRQEEAAAKEVGGGNGEGGMAFGAAQPKKRRI